MRGIYSNIIMPCRPHAENVLRMDMGCLPALSMMENRGMRISEERILALHKILTSEMEDLQSQVEKITGYAINVASGDQLAELLYNRMGLKQPGKERKTKSRTRLTVDSDILKGMISQHPVIKILLDYKERDKLRSTYTHSLLDQMDSGGRVHPDINHTGTDTGRLACSEPNLTNIPGRTKLGKYVRSSFVPDEPGEVIGVVDLSQVEARDAAEDAQCPKLMQVFLDKEDLYWSVAETIYRRKFSPEDREHGVDEETGQPMKKAFRQSAKIVALGTIYDISPDGLVDQMLSYGAIPFLTGGDTEWNYDKHYAGAVGRCEAAIRSFFDGYPELLTRRMEHHQRARRYGFVWDNWGRIRWIPQVRSCHNWIVGEGLRAAGNMPIQGFCAGLLKLWLAIIYDLVKSYWEKRGVKLIICVHDDVTVSGPRVVIEDFLQEAADIVKVMMPSHLFRTPLGASWGVADDWGSVEK